jgi:hypothetical protein
LLLSFLPAQAIDSVHSYYQGFQRNFCSDNIRNKLEAFRVQLKAANEGTDVTEEELYQNNLCKQWAFCRDCY